MKIEKEIIYTPRVAIEEASRCLLCQDAPCSKECPAGTSPDLFIRSLFFKNIKGAAERIRENNILGGVCSYVCPTEKYCMKGCSRSGIDKPIQIDKIQKFLVNYEKSVGQKTIKKVSLDREKIAVVGAGPSGLSAASELAKKGYKITVYDENDKIGGWLRYGIPDYRLDKDILDYEIGLIKEQGVEFQLSKKYGVDFTLDELRKSYSAILFATGEDDGKTLKEFEVFGGIKAVDFLKNIGKYEISEKDILVIGGGDVAFDVACSAKNRGANIKMVALETLENLPAGERERAVGVKMSVPIYGGFEASEIESDRVKFISLDKKDSITIKYDMLILAIGQKSTLKNIEKLRKEKGVFFSGDICQEDKTVVWSIKLGKKAAENIDRFLKGESKC